VAQGAAVARAQAGKVAGATIQATGKAGVQAQRAAHGVRAGARRAIGRKPDATDATDAPEEADEASPPPAGSADGG
jgi:hypothetical protein